MRAAAFFFVIGVVALLFSLAAYINHWSNERKTWCDSQKGIQVNTPHGDVCIRATVLRRPQ